MPEQPAEDTVWCDVCQENVPADYAHAHTEQVSEDAVEKIREIKERRKGAAS